MFWSDEQTSNYRLLLQMKKIATIALAATLVGSSLSAQEESSYSITMDFPYVSNYVFRGLQFAEESIQPSIEFASGDFYAGIWTSNPIVNGPGAAAYANEIDFYLGYGWALSDTWALDAGFTYYYYPETPSGDEQQEPYVGIAGDFGGGASGSLYGFYDFETEATTFQIDFGYSIEMSDTSTFDLAAAYGTVSADGGGDYNYYSLSGTINLALNDMAGTYLGVVFTDASEAFGVDNDVYFIAGLSLGF
jgi:uncharacterized protein (TIGR02001 family)